MERKVGEVFDYKGKRLQVRKANSDGCDDCFFDKICTRDTSDITGHCDEDLREDGIEVYFKEINEIMTREEMKDLLPIMQAFADGKTIEYSSDGDIWIETDTPTWCSDKFYRVKKEPKYRPFKNQEECLNEMLKHQPFGWFRSTCNKNLFNTICIDNDGIKITNNLMKSMNSYSNAFSSIKFIDGTPFGIME